VTDSTADLSVDLAIIGSGPAGYVAAIRAAQLGLSVACIERDALGGTCLNVGCIPSKALLDATEHLAWIREGAGKVGIVVGDVAVDWPKMQKHRKRVVSASSKGVAYLFRKNGIEHVEGAGEFVEPGLIEVVGQDSTRRVRASSTVIATGSAPIVIVVGGGYIGLEMGSVYQRVGSRVTIVEALDTILPGMDAELAAEGFKVFTKQGLDIRTSTLVTSANVTDQGVEVELSSGDEGETASADVMLVAIGRRPVIDGLSRR
jgi:dihydrolipoamide dehydrogenase